MQRETISRLTAPLKKSGFESLDAAAGLLRQCFSWSPGVRSRTAEQAGNATLSNRQRNPEEPEKATVRGTRRWARAGLFPPLGNLHCLLKAAPDTHHRYQVAADFGKLCRLDTKTGRAFLAVGYTIAHVYGFTQFRLSPSHPPDCP